MRSAESVNSKKLLVDPNRIRDFQSQILRWHRHNKRDLPWRQTSDPYLILISEFFLQRTQSKQVIPIFGVFIRKYPTIKRLAKEDSRNIRKYMKPLGLAKKVKYISAIAKRIIKEHDGDIPNDYAKLVALPGIGIYTASAILCFGFGEQRPIVDRNVARLINRVFGLKCKIERAHTNKKLWELMMAFLPKGRAKEFNQALLDLEDSICKPKSPMCHACPLSNICSHSWKMQPHH